MCRVVIADRVARLFPDPDQLTTCCDTQSRDHATAEYIDKLHPPPPRKVDP